MFSAEHVNDSWSDIAYVQTKITLSSAYTNCVLCQLETPVDVALQAFIKAKQETTPLTTSMTAYLFFLIY